MRSRCSGLLILLILAGTAAPAQAQLVAAPYLATNVAGDAETGRGGVGASVGYYFGGRLGVELDVERHGHFFKDEDVADLVPPGIDLNTDATLFMANLVAPVRVPGPAIWRPFGTAGLGAIHSVFDSRGADEYDRDQLNLAFNAGAGVMHALTHLVGLRAEVRYFRAFVDEGSSENGYAQDYDFWRVSFGVTIGFPR